MARVTVTEIRAYFPPFQRGVTSKGKLKSILIKLGMDKDRAEFESKNVFNGTTHCAGIFCQYQVSKEADKALKLLNRLERKGFIVGRLRPNSTAFIDDYDNNGKYKHISVLID